MWECNHLAHRSWEQKKCWHMLGKKFDWFQAWRNIFNIMQHCPIWCTDECNMLCPTCWHNMFRSFARALRHGNSSASDLTLNNYFWKSECSNPNERVMHSLQLNGRLKLLFLKIVVNWNKYTTFSGPWIPVVQSTASNNILGNFSTLHN